MLNTEEVSDTTEMSTREQINKLARSMRSQEGFVWVNPGKKGYRMSGMFVPGMPTGQEFVVNRFLVPDNRCPQWFLDLCEELVIGKIPDMMVRVNMVGVAGDVMAFVMPKARNREHALTEWARYRDEYHVGRLIVPTQSMTDPQYCRAAYDLIANDHNAQPFVQRTSQRLEIIDYLAGPKNAPHSKALAMNVKTGALMLFSNALASRSMIPRVDYGSEGHPLENFLKTQESFATTEVTIRAVMTAVTREKLTTPEQAIELIQAQRKHIPA